MGKKETGRDRNMQLYNLKEDRSQQNNLADKNPKIVAAMIRELEIIKKNNE